MNFLSCIITLFLLLHTTGARAEELQENFVPVRPMGMGNAFTAVANDENAIWSNPAGIARARKARSRNHFISRFPNIGGGANAKSRSFYEGYASTTEQSLAETISESESLGDGKPYYANAHFYPIFMYDYDRNVPGAFGIISNSETRMLIEEDTPEQARVRITSDTGAVTNIAWTNRTNRITAGIQVKYLRRYAYEDNIPTNDLKEKTKLQARIESGVNQTQGVAIDVGALYTVADFWYPTIGFSILNLPTGCQDDYLNPHSKKRETVCGSKFSGTIENNDALSLVDPTDIRLGVAISPRLSRSLGLRIALDAHHLYVNSGTQYYGLQGVEAQKLIHAGMELYIGNPLKQSPFSLRAGVNQGFITSGFSVHFAYVALDFATYGVDVSSSSKQVEDRRYITTLSLIF